MKTLRVQGIYVGSRAMLRESIQAFAAHGVRPVIDRVFAFREAPEALRSMRAGEHFGKLVISLG